MRVRVLRGEGYRAVGIASRSVEVAVSALRTVAVAIVAIESATCATAAIISTGIAAETIAAIVMPLAV